MRPKPSPWLALSPLVAAVLLSAAPGLGESAPSIAAGGLVPRHDSRIAIAKQVVHISDRKVVVEYDFRNDTEADISTDLGFAVPPYKNEWDMLDPAIQAFRSLKVWANGQPVEYRSEATADIEGRDVTKTLEKARIDIASFGHLKLGRDQHDSNRTVFAEDYERLPPKERKRLRSEGIFKGEEGYCLYTVHLQYHWMQSFPAHSTVHIRQEYVPVVGFTQAPPQADELKAALLQSPPKAGAQPAVVTSQKDANPLGGFCADAPFVSSILEAQKAFSRSWGTGVLPHWVDFDLLTATDWHKPIEDFTLVVDIPQPQHGERTLISFCAPGVVEKRNSDHPQVHLTNYTPATGLHIGFFNAPVEDLPPGVAAR